MADLDNILEEESKTNVEPSVHEGKKDENVEVGEKLMAALQSPDDVYCLQL